MLPLTADLTHSNANVTLREAEITELMSLFCPRWSSEGCSSNITVQNLVIHFGLMFLASAWPTWIKPTQPQNNTCKD